MSSSTDILAGGDAGRFGPFGGQFVPETLMPCLRELEEEYGRARRDPAFRTEFAGLLKDYSGRPTPLYRARRLEEHCGGKARIWLKREDLNHTGAHKINNCLGQVLLAKRMGKTRIVAETGAGQHGVASATVCALMGLECTVYMGEVDIVRQAPNVRRMKLMGAQVIPVTAGARTLKDATSEAIRDWVTNVADTHYIIGSTVGPHPYPAMVRDFQSVIGTECREQILAAEGRLPHGVVACVGGGSNAIGIFTAFLDDADVALYGIEAGGSEEGHSAALSKGEPGVLHGSYSYLMQDEDGQVVPAHSIAAGLDYPGVGPQHSHLKDIGRVTYSAVSDAQALEAFVDLSRLEGIIPALETSHALAGVRDLAARSAEGTILVVNLSGRGDKDTHEDGKGSGMTRLTELTSRLKSEGRKPIVPFLTAGYPDRETFRGVMEAAAEVGCPVVEIGFPFSDPVADGPVIQAASMQALARGMTLEGTIELAAEVGRDFDLAVVIMGYLNPILKMGAERFARACGQAGIAGVIVPDLPLEEAAALRAVLRDQDAELVDLVAPTTGEDRMTDHREAAGGFLYLVSTTGVTGSGPGSGDDLESYVARVRSASPLPLYVGFGIADPAQAARVAGCADGAVVGSALIRVIDEAGSGPAAVAAARRFLHDMTAAMTDPDSARTPERNEE